MDIQTQAKLAKQSCPFIMNAQTEVKNTILKRIAQNLKQDQETILLANQKDLEIATKKGFPDNLLDRMRLDSERMEAIIEGVFQVAALEDPIGETLHPKTLANGLSLQQIRVPLGLVGMIYEARPNVTVDAAVLCIKSGNAVMLRGSKDIYHSNIALVKCMQKALEECALPKEIITLVEDTSHEAAATFMRLHGYLDVLIPRGGSSLIQSCVENASVPLLETGTGNCHLYIDKDADLAKAYPILINAKTQRTSVCNACESVLVHKDIAQAFLPEAILQLCAVNVMIHGDGEVQKYSPNVLSANDEDYAKEYLDMEISIKVVSSLEEAIAHINTYSTHHSETIVSNNQQSIQQFLKQVDSACVYANASTRFSDGFEFGLGAEIGISTQKLHARGPMGLDALTSLKYIIQGDGQIRE